MPDDTMDCSNLRAAWQPQHRDLDEQLLAAHAADNKEALVSLYTQAADIAEALDDNSAARFYLTHAYIFALDIGHAEYVTLQARLDAYHLDHRT